MKYYDWLKINFFSLVCLAIHHHRQAIRRLWQRELARVNEDDNNFQLPPSSLPIASVLESEELYSLERMTNLSLEQE